VYSNRQYIRHSDRHRPISHTANHHGARKRDHCAVEMHPGTAGMGGEELGDVPCCEPKEGTQRRTRRRKEAAWVPTSRMVGTGGGG